MDIQKNHISIGRGLPIVVSLMIGGLLALFSAAAEASYLPFNTSVNMNVGIGTATPQGAFVVVNGNVGIGTWAPATALDVAGTVRVTGFTLSRQGAVNGYVLTATDSAGDATWSTVSAASGWTVSGSDVYEANSGNVGIGTTTTTQGALVVTNGNAGIGTWAPGNRLDVVSGNIGIGTAYNLVGIGTTSTILSLRTDTTSIYLGWQAGSSITKGNLDNVAVGNQALRKAVGGQNTAVGYQSLFSDTNGGDNTAMGYQALNNINIGNGDTAMGYQAEFQGDTYYNTAIGLQALYNGSNGGYETAVGYQALYNSGSTANGGVADAAVGYNALYNQSGGQSNTALGEATRVPW